MNKKLPARPNLDHLKGQAKSLLTAYGNQQSEAVSIFTKLLPGIVPKLADAQFILARQNGFESWPKLVHFVEVLRDLEGTWTFKSLQVGGNTIPAGMIGNSKILINGDRFNTLSSEGDYLGEFDIEIEVSPHTIDILFIEGPHAGSTAYGIFELRGDELTICLGLVGASRPTDFISREGSMHALEVLARESLNAPVTVANEDAPKVEYPAIEIGEPNNSIGFDVLSQDLERMQGEWSALEVVINGDALDPKFISYGKRICNGNKVLVSFGAPIIDALARTQEVNEIDYLLTGGPKKGQVQLGIYEVEGDTCRFCMSEIGQPRPTEFTSEPGSGRTLSRWSKK